MIKEKQINSEDEEELIVDQISKNSKFLQSFINPKSKVVVPKITHNQEPEENEYASKEQSIEGTNQTGR